MRKISPYKIIKHVTAIYMRHAVSLGPALLIISTALMAIHLLFDLKSNATLVIGFIIMAVGVMTIIKAAGIKR